MRQKKPVAVTVKSSGRIQVDLIPPHVAMSLGEAGYQAAVKAYQDPEFRAQYEQWKAARDMKAMIDCENK